MIEGMRPDGWVPTRAGQVPDGWVEIAIERDGYDDLAILRAWFDRLAPEPHWNTKFGRLSREATVRYWRPLPELPEEVR